MENWKSDRFSSGNGSRVMPQRAGIHSRRAVGDRGVSRRRGRPERRRDPPHPASTDPAPQKVVPMENWKSDRFSSGNGSRVMPQRAGIHSRRAVGDRGVSRRRGRVERRRDPPHPASTGPPPQKVVPMENWKSDRFSSGNGSRVMPQRAGIHSRRAVGDRGVSRRRGRPERRRDPPHPASTDPAPQKVVPMENWKSDRFSSGNGSRLMPQRAGIHSRRAVGDRGVSRRRGWAERRRDPPHPASTGPPPQKVVPMENWKSDRFSSGNGSRVMPQRAGIHSRRAVGDRGVSRRRGRPERRRDPPHPASTGPPPQKVVPMENWKSDRFSSGNGSRLMP